MYISKQLIIFRLTIVISAIFYLSCNSSNDRSNLPEQQKYEQAVSNFYVSLAAIETDNASFAFNKMLEVSKAYPEEPAVWANLGVYAMRQGNYEMAAQRLAKARKLAPENHSLLFLSAILEDIRRETAASIQYLRKAYGSDSKNLHILYLLVQKLEQQDFEQHQAEIITFIKQMIEQQPDNLALRLEAIRIYAKSDAQEALNDQLKALEKKISDWHPDTRKQFQKVKESVNENGGNLSLQLALLKNQLKSNSVYNQDILELELPANQVGFLIPEFINLPKPTLKTAPVDTSLTFTQKKPDIPGITSASYLATVILTEQLPPLPAYINEGQFRIDTSQTLAFPGKLPEQIRSTPIALLDLNYDFKNDLVLAGSSGIKLFINTDEIDFEENTATLGLPSSIINKNYLHTWTADLDVDGDLDIILSARDGAFITLLNRGDNTLKQVEFFDGAKNIAQFIWADLDADLDPDAAMIDNNGRLLLYVNERSGVFSKVDNLPVKENFAAVKQADIDADSQFELIAVQENKQIVQLFFEQQSTTWKTAELPFNLTHDVSSSETRLFIEDIDNNGHLDFLISGLNQSELFLAGNNQSYWKYAGRLPISVNRVVDIDGDRRLDLIGQNQEDTPYQFINSGNDTYHARSIRTRASGTSGDRRINSFAIGGELEIRTGLLYQKQPISSPIVHFGLGYYEETDMLRIIWPNGSVQAEFAELGIGSTIFNKQLLKGSCPWLFTHNGNHFDFITDILWRSPLGLRINAQETAGVIQTRDQVRIPGDKLNPDNGLYKLRITAELWETHFFDEVKLVAVDHPDGTNLFIDERFVFPPPDLSPRITGSLRPVAKVTDMEGKDVTEKVSSVDQNYLQPFKKTRYQGVAEPHSITIHLGDEVPADTAIWLLANGWVRPTDSSINYAISQGENPYPKGLKVEVSSANSDWRTFHKDYGFPAGKTKTVMLNLKDVFKSSKERKIRFTTTTETSWDAIHWATDQSGLSIQTTEPKPVSMVLAYRGYSKWNKKNSNSPLLPNYNKIDGTSPRWQDLEGYYTRFGPVDELLKKTDDRYVIMNAGDELKLEFKALEKPKQGFVRDFILISDGWIKDGDLNTKHSKTVLPLPAHNQPEYQQPIERLIDDPVYNKFKTDWVEYHTRYISPQYFQTALSKPSTQK